MELLFLTIPLVLGILAFRVTSGMGWHWTPCLLLALIPLGATLLFGIIGLLGSALFVGALTKPRHDSGETRAAWRPFTQRCDNLSPISSRR